MSWVMITRYQQQCRVMLLLNWLRRSPLYACVCFGMAGLQRNSRLTAQQNMICIHARTRRIHSLYHWLYIHRNASYAFATSCTCLHSHEHVLSDDFRTYVLIHLVHTVFSSSFSVHASQLLPHAARKTCCMKKPTQRCVGAIQEEYESLIMTMIIVFCFCY